jgi:hypothetical protein
MLECNQKVMNQMRNDGTGQDRVVGRQSGAAVRVIDIEQACGQKNRCSLESR